MSSKKAVPKKDSKVVAALRLEGYPNSTVIHVGLTEEPGGKKLDGDVSFLLRHTDGQEAPFKSDKGDVIVQVSNGQGKSVGFNMTSIRQAGWDTLIPVFGGQKLDQTVVLSELVAQPQLAPAAANPAPAIQSISLEGLELRFQKIGDPEPVKESGRVTAYLQKTLVTVFRKEAIVEGVTVDLYREGEKQADCQGDGLVTNEDGDINYTYAGIRPGGTNNSGSILLRARIRGTKKEKLLRADILRASRQERDGADAEGESQIGVTLLATPGSAVLKGDKMVYLITLKATRRNSSLASVGRVNWVCGTAHDTVDCQGLARHNVELTETGEHVYVATATLSRGAQICSNQLKLSGPPAKGNPKPARLTNLVCNSVPDPRDPETINYAVCFSVLDSQGNGVAKARVPRVFGSDAKVLVADDSGFCEERVSVKGYGVKLVYKVFLPGTDELKNVELPGPVKPIEEAKKPGTLEVAMASCYPGSDGKWRLLLSTKIDGVFKVVKFSLTANAAIKLQRIDWKAAKAGQLFSDLECPGGTAEFAISAKPKTHTVQLTFSLDGTQVPKDVTLRRNLWTRRK